MKPLNWVELTRQQIKARHGFGWSIQGIEKQNKVLTKIVYRFSTGERTTVLTDIEWNTSNSKKIQDLIIEFENLMEERHVDLKKAYELIVGNKVFSDKKNINWEALINEFVNEERVNRRETTKRDLKLRMKRTMQALNPKDIQRLKLVPDHLPGITIGNSVNISYINQSNLISSNDIETPL